MCIAQVQGVVATLPCGVERRRLSRASAGVSQPRVLRGRLLSAAATASRSVGVCFVEVGAVGEVLAEEAVGVLVGAALPGTLGVAEVDVEINLCAELGVLCHFGALVPGQRLSELFG